MLFFDIQKLEKLADGNDLKFVFLLYKWWKYKDLVFRKGDKFRLTEPLAGNTGWLIHPEKLFTQADDVIFMVQYIRLAAKRDLLMFNHYGVTTLPTSYYTDLNIEQLKHNPLLTITDTEIKFKYE